jgi:hypothetical protein
MSDTPSKITTRVIPESDRFHPIDIWQCSIIGSDRMGHHGVGKTEAEAIFWAAKAYVKYAKGRG